MKKPLMQLLVCLLVTFLVGGEALAQAKKRNAKEKLEQEEKEVTPIISPNRLIPGMINVHSIGIGIGQTFLLGDFEEHGDNKITVEGLYTYSASYSFDLLLGLHWSEHKFRDDKVKLLGSTFGIKGKIFQYDSFAPYVVGGLGFYYPKITRQLDGEATESIGKAVFGYNLGGGVDLRLNRRVVVGVLGQYHNPFDVKQDYGPDVEGSYFKLMMLVMYTF